MLNNGTFHICPLFSQHVLGQTIHWQLPKERWPTVGMVNVYPVEYSDGYFN